MVIGLVDDPLILIIAQSTAVMLSGPEGLFAYIGPGSGLELVAQFLALLAFMSTALLAILFQPLVSFYRFVRRKLSRGATEPLPIRADDPQGEADETHAPNTPLDQFHQEQRKDGSVPTMVTESPSEG